MESALWASPALSMHSGLGEGAIVAICSGANMDFDRLRFVSERADSSETLLSVRLPERPGSFRLLYESIYPRNVTELAYRITASAAREGLPWANGDGDGRFVRGRVQESTHRVCSQVCRQRYAQQVRPHFVEFVCARSRSLKTRENRTCTT